MSDNKKYYYLKLKDNFFDSPEIKVLEGMPNGYKYSNLLLKLYLKSLKFEGMLRLNEYIPYSVEMIAAVTGMEMDTVRVALDLFQQLKLIEKLEDGTIFMLEIQNFIGKSSTEADRKRNYRQQIDNAKGKLGQQEQLGQGQMSLKRPDKNPPEIEIEKEIEKEIEIELKIERETEKDNPQSRLLSNTDVFKHFDHCGFRLTPLQYEEIAADVDVYTRQWVMDAAKIASNRGKFSYSYVKGVLNNWLSEGRKDGEDDGSSKQDTHKGSKYQEYDFSGFGRPTEPFTGDDIETEY